MGDPEADSTLVQSRRMRAASPIVIGPPSQQAMKRSSAAPCD